MTTLDIIAEVTVSRAVECKHDMHTVCTLDSLISHYKNLAWRNEFDREVNNTWAEFYSLLKRRIQTGKY